MKIIKGIAIKTSAHASHPSLEFFFATVMAIEYKKLRSIARAE
jgi:hypothetical protein